MVKIRQNNNSDEVGVFEMQIPSKYLNAYPLSGVGEMPYSSMFKSWDGFVSRYAKIQGSGTMATVVDLSEGNFTVSGAMQESSGAPPAATWSSLAGLLHVSWIFLFSSH